MDFLPSEPDFGDQPLNLWSLMPLWGILVSLTFESSSDSILFQQCCSVHGLLPFGLSNSIQSSNIRSSFWSQSSRFGFIGKPWNFFISFFHHGAGKHSNIRSNDTTSNRSPLSFTFSLGSISLRSRLKQQANSGIGKNTLFHGKTIFVKATVDSKNIAFELFSKIIGFHFLAHSLFEEDSALVIVIDFKGFCGPVGRIRNTELNYDDGIPSLMITKNNDFIKFN